MFASKLSMLTTKLGNFSNIFSFKLPMQLIERCLVGAETLEMLTNLFVSRASCWITLIGWFNHKICQFSIDVNNLPTTTKGVYINKIVNTFNISNISGKFPESFLESFRQNKFMEVLQPYWIHKQYF